MYERNGQVSPTKTVGETTTSLPVGDNYRKKKQDSPPLTNGFRSVNVVKSDEATVEGRRSTTNTNGEVSSAGSPTSPLHDRGSPVNFHSKKEPEKWQSPPNPFIFPSKFQGSMKDAENRTSISEVFESSARKQNHSAVSSPQEHIETQTEVQPKYNKSFQETHQNDVNALQVDDDSRPEVAKLPGRKRVASWGKVQDKTTLAKEAASSAKESTPLANARGPPVKPPPYSGTMTKIESPLQNEQEHDLTENPSDNLKRLENSAIQDSVAVQNRVQLFKHPSNPSSVSLSPSISQQNSVSNNRKSWDGVRHPGETEEDQRVSRMEKQKDNKERSCSDSNLMVRKRLSCE